jgi:predicted MPP superfamily phosphohydrolase
MPWAINVVLILAIASSPFEWYAATRIAASITTLTSWRPRRTRCATAAVIFYPLSYPLVTTLSYLLGAPKVYQQRSLLVDALLTYPFWIGVVFAVQLSFALLLLDAGRLVLYPAYRKHRDRWLASQAGLTLLLTGAIAIYCGLRIYTDTCRVQVRHAAFQVAGLPAELDGLKIAQISDVHVDIRTNGGKLDRYIQAVNAQSPDLIIFCGDLVSSGTAYIDQAATALGRLRAKYGVFACLGDHDYFSDPEMVASRLELNGITVLRDEYRLVKTDGGEISLTGVTNVYRKPASPGAVLALAEKRPHRGLDIFYTHQPSNWIVESAAAAGYNLFLAGHTHGGQIAFPLPGFILTGSSFETHYVTGGFKQGDTWINICNGLGLTLAPIRYRAPAELTIIEVRREARSKD